jgi:hypothetical protein
MVLKVIQHDTVDDVYYVVTGWARSADCLGNIMKTPQVVVHVGFRRFDAVAEEIPINEADDKILIYAKKYYVPFKILTYLM